MIQSLPEPEPQVATADEPFGFTEAAESTFPAPQPEPIEFSQDISRPQELVFEAWQQESTVPEEDSPFAEPAIAETTPTPDFTAVIEPVYSPVAAAARDLRDAVQTPDPMTETWTSTPGDEDEKPSDISDLLEKSRAKFKQNELLFEGSTRGRFADTDPTIVDGDDLDIPPFLRKKKK